MSVNYVALGDSTAVGVGAPRGGGYPERLASRLRRAGLSVGLTNLGVSGARVRDVFTGQLKATVAAQPTLVTLGVGTNDLWRGTAVEDFQEELERIARRLKQTGAPLVLVNIADMAMAPVAKLVPSALYEGRIEPFNAAIAQVARTEGLHLVDMYSASREMFPRSPHFFSGDGFHPSEEGYEEWADLMLPTVRTLVSR
ncbi:SGNH/GDSL hydrolase family protein [Myxococcus llanfairpwllgwyngyllgogerychwyrndrobwllllantysiliogogogochensis]|uniref:SGNH/GDSL hydrolase family protein n=1 Tax=Myxococcus llanfairpwllgwyngyllgogerychwyrndrobwllllantysiliogogogochensis TaxID=2590453 RepID=A0A540WJ06_9BACT|nr:SGNH/GDSL hydrolase family protein [Myxococcus llanfairpwllgwyngyllgogerychwyrndrobwllllantysiliogogogochensis]TQF09006.1 SGNH/GDSL hydrolase family protein [Myxococcus llanfairpwllgwyngyllgogerychwyrndrobwllllantysiliogogogochensis]